MIRERLRLPRETLIERFGRLDEILKEAYPLEEILLEAEAPPPPHKEEQRW